MALLRRFFFAFAGGVARLSLQCCSLVAVPLSFFLLCFDIMLPFSRLILSGFLLCSLSFVCVSVCGCRLRSPVPPWTTACSRLDSAGRTAWRSIFWRESNPYRRHPHRRRCPYMCTTEVRHWELLCDSERCRHRAPVELHHHTHITSLYFTSRHTHCAGRKKRG